MMSLVISFPCSSLYSVTTVLGRDYRNDQPCKHCGCHCITSSFNLQRNITAYSMYTIIIIIIIIIITTLVNSLHKGF